MVTAIRDDMFTPDVIADPYTYYGRLRAEDPVHDEIEAKGRMDVIRDLADDGL
jgi:hypothetical protein